MPVRGRIETGVLLGKRGTFQFVQEKGRKTKKKRRIQEKKEENRKEKKNNSERTRAAEMRASANDGEINEKSRRWNCKERVSPFVTV